MALFVESTVRARAQQEVRKTVLKTARQLIIDAASKFESLEVYDVFLSHSVYDSELILGMKGIIEDLGYKVYVDWIDDQKLDRQRVSKETAKKLRDRMNASNSLFFVTTENADNSKWMPWECGYFDGLKGKVAIVPVQKYSVNDEYVGQEYLGLYPYVVKGKSKEGKERLWIHLDTKRYVIFDDWVKTPANMIKWTGT